MDIGRSFPDTALSNVCAKGEKQMKITIKALSAMTLAAAIALTPLAGVTASAEKQGWRHDKNGYYYYIEEDGSKASGWTVINDITYYFEKDGITYNHILDPGTGMPADSGLISVTIVSRDGCLADALSTSLFVMGKEKALAYWETHSDSFDVILVEEDGGITVTRGLDGIFSSELKYEIYPEG